MNSITNTLIILFFTLSIIRGQELVPDEVELIGNKAIPEKGFRPFSVVFQPPVLAWRASAVVIGGAEGGGPIGEIIFRQWSPGDIVNVVMNISGLPPGKHAVHIHEFGDLREGCISTGSHVSNLGNIEVKDNGLLEIRFNSPFITLFGSGGIIGRSIVIHEKPIEYGQYPDIQAIPLIPTLNSPRHQTEEMRTGPIIACGIVTITSNRQQMVKTM